MKLLDLIGARGPVNSDGPPFTHGVTRSTMGGSDPVLADSTFRSMVAEIHERSGPVSAAVTARALLLSQVWFAWADAVNPSVSSLEFGGLDRLNMPQGVTRSSLLFRMEQDASYAGTAFLAARRGEPVRRLDPSRVTYAFRSNSDPTWSAEGELRLPYDAEVSALVYNSAESPTLGLPRPASIDDLEVFYPGEFVRWMPEPDPVHWWRGQSWITSLLHDVALDGQISDHQSKFFKHAATPNLVFIMDRERQPEEVQAYADIVNEKHAGTRNAWRNMFLGGAVDVKTVGIDPSKLSLKDVQGGLETRVAMRSRVPAVILGAREGLSGSSLNTGNYTAARRLFAEGWFTTAVNSLCEAVEPVFDVPRGRRLAHDPSRVLFLQEDRKDEAEINQAKVTAIRTLVDGGFDPASAVAALAPEWAGKLEHAGLLSVQLQEPGTSNAARAVMGRLGRIDDAEMIDPDALVDGLGQDETAVVLAALDEIDAETTPMTEVRALVRAALTGVTR